MLPLRYLVINDRIYIGQRSMNNNSLTHNYSDFVHINLDKFFKPFGKGIEMTNKNNNIQAKTSSPIWWLVSAMASVFIGSKLIIGNGNCSYCFNFT